MTTETQGRLLRRTLRDFQVFPVFMAMAWIVVYFALASSPLHHLWRPLLIVGVGSTALTLVGAAFARGKAWRILLSGTVVVALFGAWLSLALLLVLMAWRGVVDWMRIRAGRQPFKEPAPRQIIRLANALGTAALIVALIRVFATVPAVPRLEAPPPAGGHVPNIYVVMLDGYPRADKLAEFFGISNAGFTDALSQRAFSVASGSLSNYTKTQLTVATMLHMRYAHEIDGLRPTAEDPAGQIRRISAAINGPSPAVDILRSHGYWISSRVAVFGEAAFLRANEVSEHHAMTSFEEQAARATLLAPTLAALGSSAIHEQQRDAVASSIETLPLLAERREPAPVFAYVHVLSPHTPFLFAADGSLPPPAPCYPTACGLWERDANRLGYSRQEYADGLEGQLDWLNAQILDAVDRVIASDPEGVIILMSDHGTRFDTAHRDEYFYNFFAARTPGTEELFPHDIHPVNVLGTVFDTYLGEKVTLREYRAWHSSHGHLDLRPASP